MWNLLNQFAAYYRPCESEAGEVDRIYQEYCNELIRILEKPADRSFSGIISKMGTVGRIIAGGIKDPQGADLFEQLIIHRASAQFASFRERQPDKKSLRTIFLTGDIYLRLDDFGSDSIIRRLNARGMRVIVEPLWAFAQSVVEERSAELFNMPQGFFMNSVAKILMPKSPETVLRYCSGKKSLATLIRCSGNA